MFGVENLILRFASSGGASLLLALLVLRNVCVSMCSNEAMTVHMYKIMNDIIPFNRVFGYYMDNYICTYHAGKDIRIFGQQSLISKGSMELFTDSRHTLERFSANQKKYTGLVAVSSATMNILIYLLVGLRALAGTVGIGKKLKS